MSRTSSSAAAFLGEMFFGDGYFQAERSLPERLWREGQPLPFSFVFPLFGLSHYPASFPPEAEAKTGLYWARFKQNKKVLIREFTTIKEEYLKYLILFLLPNKDDFFVHTVKDLKELAQDWLRSERTASEIQAQVRFLVSKGFVSRTEVSPLILYGINRERLAAYIRDRSKRANYVITPKGAQVASFLYPHLFLMQGYLLPVPMERAIKAFEQSFQRKVTESLVRKHCLVVSYGRVRLALKRFFRPDLKVPVVFSSTTSVTRQQVLDTLELNGVQINKHIRQAVREAFAGWRQMDWDAFIFKFFENSTRRYEIWESFQKSLKSILTFSFPMS